MDITEHNDNIVGTSFNEFDSKGFKNYIHLEAK